MSQIKTLSDTDRSNAESVPQDIAFDLLSARRRRYVLHCLFQQQGSLDLRDLSRQIAAWENDISPPEVTYKQRMRTYTALRQSHLPKMDRAGIVKFDSDRGSVELTQDASKLKLYLTVLPHDDIPWSHYYLGLGLICGGAVAGAGIGLPPFSLVPELGWAALLVMAFAVSALVHVYHDRQMRIALERRVPE